MISFDQPWRRQLDWSAPPAHNTQVLWLELFGKDIDVRASIIAPALAERRRAYGQGATGWKAKLSGIEPSK